MDRTGFGFGAAFERALDHQPDLNFDGTVRAGLGDPRQLEVRFIG